MTSDKGANKFICMYTSLKIENKLSTNTMMCLHFLPQGPYKI
jgi:hypothetical protein